MAPLACGRNMAKQSRMNAGGAKGSLDKSSQEESIWQQIHEIIFSPPQKDYFFFIFTPLSIGLAIIGWCYLTSWLHSRSEDKVAVQSYPLEPQMQAGGPGAVWGENPSAGHLQPWQTGVSTNMPMLPPQPMMQVIPRPEIGNGTGYQLLPNHRLRMIVTH